MKNYLKENEKELIERELSNEWIELVYKIAVFYKEKLEKTDKRLRPEMLDACQTLIDIATLLLSKENLEYVFSLYSKERKTIRFSRAKLPPL